MTVDNELPPKRSRPYNKNYYKCFQNFYNSHEYLGLNPHYYTDTRSAVNHWQLRDMLQVDSQTGRVFYSREDKIRSLDLESKKQRVYSEVALSLDYFPRCFHQTSGGYMVTGGLITSASKVLSSNIPTLTSASNSSPATTASLSSSFSKEQTSTIKNSTSKGSVASAASNPGTHIRNLVTFSSRPCKGILTFQNPNLEGSQTVALGDMINNSVSIYQNNNSSFTSYICNNDSNLYVVDIGNSTKLSLDRKINCELNTALNNAVRSPMSEKVLTVTGDSSSIFLVDPTSKDTRISTIKTPHDSGFGVSYHPNGTTFAAAFQDGSCVLYDIRNLPKRQSLIPNEPLYTFKSTRAGHQSGAFRCCKFSQTGVNDLLVISEHVGRVHLIDVNKAMSEPTPSQGHQVMVFPYALDQYGSSKKQKILSDDDSKSIHSRVPIYQSDNDSESFPSPLVFDYDYLVNVNPQLFKDFSYTPNMASPVNSQSRPSPLFNVPNWNSNTSTDIDRDSYDYYERSRTGFISSVGGSYADSIYNCREQTPVTASHINGEMELSGVDWFEECLLIGCEDGGILSWDMNSRARKNSASFAYV
ncbi:hypothetical protein CAAN1_02S06436 [[Candida] anglica]|uniref:DUF2415 domain-containing protein n=1 Tax=[Candida] anglica TaxID=148631 RepID=A0ABP0EC52_9ASCO